MELTATIAGKPYAIGLAQPHDLSIPVQFEGDGLSAFGAPLASKEPYRIDGFVGDVRAGGSCNCELYHFSPHLHGTHTEGVGHITQARVAVHTAAMHSLHPATVVTLAPQRAETIGESYDPVLRPDDLVLTKTALVAALGSDDAFLQALVIRTLPNALEKKTQRYNGYLPPFFTREAMAYLVARGVQHLLVDMPSIDRMDDEGKLTNHRLFWEVAPGVVNAAASPKTVTELIYVADHVRDGKYMLNLQVAAFMADAAPSKPVLYEVTAL